MSEEVDRNDPELKYLSVERNQFNDPATQAEWTQKRLVWVPHENQVSAARRTFILAEQPLGLCELQLLTNTVHTTFHMPSTHKDIRTHTERSIFLICLRTRIRRICSLHSSAFTGLRRSRRRGRPEKPVERLVVLRRRWPRLRSTRVVAVVVVGVLIVAGREFDQFFYFLLSSLRLFLVRFVE